MRSFQCSSAGAFNPSPYAASPAHSLTVVGDISMPTPFNLFFNTPTLLMFPNLTYPPRTLIPSLMSITTPSYCLHKQKTMSLRPSKVVGPIRPSSGTLVLSNSSFVSVMLNGSPNTYVFLPTSSFCVPLQLLASENTPGVLPVVVFQHLRHGTSLTMLNGRGVHGYATFLTVSTISLPAPPSDSFALLSTPECFPNSSRILI